MADQTDTEVEPTGSPDAPQKPEAKSRVKKNLGQSLWNDDFAKVPLF